MYIVVGLGNKGFEYKNTYHNVGFFVADSLAKRIGAQFTKEKYKAEIAEGNYRGQKVLIAKPTTYMNNSGEAVTLLKNKFKDAQLIVTVDDIDLAKGVVRYRERGSAGTHNGLRSIVSFVGEEFQRVKVGIGRDKNKDLADFVLSVIDGESRKIIDEAVERAVDLILNKIAGEGKC